MASFLFIFVLFKHNLYRKTVGVSGIRTRIIGVEGEHADHLTTTTAQVGLVWAYVSYNTKLTEFLMLYYEALWY